MILLAKLGAARAESVVLTRKEREGKQVPPGQSPREERRE
jgi:hypothetical protein